MDNCCENKTDELAALRMRQGRVLYVVFGVNLVMFLVEFTSGWLAQSTALLGDSLDMLGDASVYAVTLYALTASARTRAGVTIFKGIAMLIFGVVVVIEATRKAVMGAVPDVGVMAVVGGAALAANAVCFALLHRHRGDDLNMRSTWLCSRNDLIANVSVLCAAGLVAVTASLWPDVVIGVAIALLFLRSARQVLTEAWAEWRTVTSDGEHGRAGGTASRPSWIPRFSRRVAVKSSDSVVAFDARQKRPQHIQVVVSFFEMRAVRAIFENVKL